MFSKFPFWSKFSVIFKGKDTDFYYVFSNLLCDFEKITEMFSRVWFLLIYL